MTTRKLLRVGLEKNKSGLIQGILARFYHWNETLPLDIVDLKLVAETILLSFNQVWIGKPHEKVRESKYIVEFTGFIKVDYEDQYRFHIIANGGVKFWFNNELLIDSWDNKTLQKQASNIIRLKQGYYRIRLLYCNWSKPGEIRLKMERPSGIEDISVKNIFFTIGEIFFVTNLPDNYVIVFTPINPQRSVKKCTAINDICMVELKYYEQPYECLVSIYNDRGELIYRSTQSLIMWGGDEYKLTLIETGDSNVK